MKYEEPKEGEWIRPIKRGYKMACCDCGLVTPPQVVDYLRAEDIGKLEGGWRK